MSMQHTYRNINNSRHCNDVKKIITIRLYLRDTEIVELLETPDCGVEDVPEHESHTREESETSGYDDNIVARTVHNVILIQSKHQNINWSMDPSPRFGCLNSANFLKIALQA
ncbi:hypothetical protein AVEN_84063-1 [Araneus ventricosus]|uniref:Uncharacterized protein n=1 Tax=Araneus ventricosus TaxID=182803 RepID=A0A4Y2VIC0_ARAVE|nr:hypothetical protein AVEN_84063-1 [Araneus ventricosus]